MNNRNNHQGFSHSIMAKWGSIMIAFLLLFPLALSAQTVFQHPWQGKKVA